MKHIQTWITLSKRDAEMVSYLENRSSTLKSQIKSMWFRHLCISTWTFGKRIFFECLNLHSLRRSRNNPQTYKMNKHVVGLTSIFSFYSWRHCCFSSWLRFVCIWAWGNLYIEPQWCSLLAAWTALLQSILLILVLTLAMDPTTEN